MPTLSFHVPEDWRFQRLFSKAVAGHASKRQGAYIREAVERDLQHGGAMPYGAGISPAQFSHWQKSETFLLSRIATAQSILKTKDDSACVDLARQLACEMIEMAMRPVPDYDFPTTPEEADALLLAAEERAAYPATDAVTAVKARIAARRGQPHPETQSPPALEA